MWKWCWIALVVWSPSAHAIDEHGLAGLLEEARTEMDMPGVRAAVRYPDGRIVRAAVGLADKENEIALDDTVGMPGGSTGKTFVAALTMLLVEDGTLSLDDPASKWLGDRKWFKKLPNSDDILVRHLLSHSAGLGDYPGSKSWMLSMVWRVMRKGTAYFEPEELIGYAKNKPMFPAGEGYRYSDVGYLVLGRVIEAASGREYYDLLDERILGPLGLDQIRPQDQSALPNITPGYQGGVRNLKKDGRMKFDPRSEWTGGGLVMNPTMLTEFHAALAEGRIVQSETFDRMLEGGWRNPARDWHYGLGVFVNDGGRSFGHDGMWVGYRTQVDHDLTTGITIAVQTNRDGRVDMRGLGARIKARVARGSLDGAQAEAQ